MTANKRIFLNIVATYGRSLYALLIGLFTARWCLQVLGVVDYGLMGVIGALPAFIGYFNGILSGAIGRYYAISVGKEQTDYESGLEESRMWFTTSVVIHAVVPVILMAIGYPLGEYAVRHWLTIPPDRVVACVWVWRFVCVSCFLGMVSIPLNAMYGAKQYIAELTIYSFVTTTLNALFLYYMVTHPGVWLAKYAFFQCLLGVLPNIIIATRAVFLFPECRFVPKYINCIGNIKKLGGYALWNAWGTLGAMLRDQGSTVLINVNFGPAVNAGVAVGGSLSGHCNTLSGCMIGAFSPAVFNAWGAGLYDRARTLAYQTCKLGALFILLFAIPLCLEVDEVLLLWLKNPPRYAAEFCIAVLCMAVIDKMAVGHMIAVNANGKIAMYQAFLGTSLVLTLPIAWLLVHLGCGPLSVGFAMISTMIFCASGRVLFARKLVGTSAWYWLKRICIPLAVLTVVTLAIGYVPRLFMQASFMRVCVTTILVELVMLPLSWFIVMDASEREFVMSRIGPMLANLRGGNRA